MQKLAERVTSAEIYALAVTSLSVINVWLCVQNVRWLVYTREISQWMPGVDYYDPRSFNPILEAPGLAVGLIAAYVLIVWMAGLVWKIRYSIFRSAVTTRVLSLNSILLMVLTLLGVAQWMAFFGSVPIDLVVAVVLGAAAAFLCLFLELREAKSNAFKMERFFPLSLIVSLSSIWGRSRK